MSLARFDNILAIKTQDGRVVGFHAVNLQVARLDEQVWTALEDPSQVRNDVKAEVLEWNAERDPEVTDGRAPNGIRTLSVNVAQICNMRCSYCAAGGDGTYGARGSKTAHIDLEKFKAQMRMLLDRVPDGGKFTINFIGGEPLIYPKTIQAIADDAREWATPRDLKLRFEITTNATLVTPEIAEMLADLRAFVTVSIDGPPETNDLDRKLASGKGSSALALQGVERLLVVQDRLGALACNAVFGAHNTDVVGSWNFLRQYPWDMIYLGYAAGPDDAVYSPRYAQGLATVAARAFEIGGEAELRRISQFDHLFRILDGKSRIHNHCGAGKTLLQVDTSGKFYACNWWTNVKEEEVGEDLTLDKAALEKFAPSLIELNNCGSCWARHVCGGGCMFVNRLRTGDKHRKDTEFCNRTRHIIARGIEYYEQSRYEHGQGD
ncbi:MAG: radical SAM protein [Bdellovibrionaceae bacterium]|nr:radical SAM protein [Pseudobdellovibrionaceae bacterium]